MTGRDASGRPQPCILKKADVREDLKSAERNELVKKAMPPPIIMNKNALQQLSIGHAPHARRISRTPRCIWLTGLSGAGKSTIAELLDRQLHAGGLPTYLLDGDILRRGLNRDLGFSDVDRAENIRRVAEVARLMVDAGLTVLVAFISPFRAERRLARDLFGVDQFVEVFVDTSVAECERRDPKGLYAKARRGEVKKFTGIDSVYEPPEAPEVHLLTEENSAESCVEQILAFLKCVTSTTIR